MMKCECAKRDVVSLDRFPFNDIGFMVPNFRVIGAQSPGDFQCSRLAIEGINLYLSVNFARITDDQTRDVTGARCQIDHAQFVGWPDPTAHETQNKTIASEPAIELPNTFQIS